MAHEQRYGPFGEAFSGSRYRDADAAAMATPRRHPDSVGEHAGDQGSGGGQLAFEALEVAGDPELGGYVARAAR